MRGNPLGGKIASQCEAIPQMWTKPTTLPLLVHLLTHLSSSVLAQFFVLCLHFSNSIDWIIGGLEGRKNLKTVAILHLISEASNTSWGNVRKKRWMGMGRKWISIYSMLTMRPHTVFGIFYTFFFHFFLIYHNLEKCLKNHFDIIFPWFKK